MPTQEVERAPRPSTLLRRNAQCDRPVLLDGGGPDSWLHGDVLYTDSPAATLEVFASGWARWGSAGSDLWRWGDPLDQWDAFMAAGRAALRAPADGAGFLSVLAYDLKHWIERLPRRQAWPGTPVLYCARYDWSYRASYRNAAARIAAARGDLLAERQRWYEPAVAHADREDAARAPEREAPRSRCPQPALSREQYTEMIARAQKYIGAGDVYEINLAQPFGAAAVLHDAPALFAAWTSRYPMPFAAYVDAGPWVVLSNSPECFLHVDGQSVTTYPIKGTRRREPGRSSAARAADLRGDAKEQAEHVMVVDLERNDLGRVCEIGSVEVPEFAAVRDYPLLAHMVSEVRGHLRSGTSLAALMRATFPGGSITGAPKVRAMQLIEALEPAARGFYTGAIGWTEMDGTSRFSITIRSAVVHRTGLTYWAGGGIVADSDAAREYEESLLKAETFFRALATFDRRGA